jgi:hypothetical protein
MIILIYLNKLIFFDMNQSQNNIQKTKNGLNIFTKSKVKSMLIIF